MFQILVNMGKYYVVKRGRKPGIYTTWQDCEGQTKGYSNNLYATFESLAEAKKWGGANLQIYRSEDKNQPFITRYFAPE